MNSKSKNQAGQNFKIGVVSLTLIFCCLIVTLRRTDDKSRRNAVSVCLNSLATQLHTVKQTAGLNQVMSYVFVTVEHGIYPLQITSIHGFGGKHNNGKRMKNTKWKSTTYFASDLVVYVIDAFFQSIIYQKKSLRIRDLRDSEYFDKKDHWVNRGRNRQLYDISNQPPLNLEKKKIEPNLMNRWIVDEITTSDSNGCGFLFTTDDGNTKWCIAVVDCPGCHIFPDDHSTGKTYSNNLSKRIDANYIEYLAIKKILVIMLLWDFGTDYQAEYLVNRIFPEVQQDDFDMNKTAEEFISEYVAEYFRSDTMDLYRRILYMDHFPEVQLYGLDINKTNKEFLSEDDDEYFRSHAMDLHRRVFCIVSFHNPKLWYQDDGDMLVLLDTSFPTASQLNNQQNTSILLFSADCTDVPISKRMQTFSVYYHTLIYIIEGVNINFPPNKFKCKRSVLILSEISFEIFNENLLTGELLHNLGILQKKLSTGMSLDSNLLEHYNHNVQNRPLNVSVDVCCGRQSYIALKLKSRLSTKQISSIGDTYFYNEDVQYKHYPDNETRQLRISNDTVKTNPIFGSRNHNYSFAGFKKERHQQNTLTTEILYQFIHPKVENLQHSNSRERNWENVLPWSKCREIFEDLIIIDVVKEQSISDFVNINLKYFKPNHTTYTADHGMEKLKVNLLFALTTILALYTCYPELKTFGPLLLTVYRRHSNRNQAFLPEFLAGKRLQRYQYANMKTKSTIFEKGDSKFPSFPSFIFSHLRIPSVINFVYPVQRKTVNELLSQCEGDLSNSTENPMSYELLRLETFSRFPLTCPIRPLVLAEAGFFCTNNGDEACCFCCSLRYSGWGVGDSPRTIHAQLAPECRFIRGEESGNVSIIRQVTQREDTRQELSETFTQSDHNTNAMPIPRDERSVFEINDTSHSPSEERRHQDRSQVGNRSAGQGSLSRNFAVQLQIQEIRHLRQDQIQIQSDSTNQHQSQNTQPRITSAAKFPECQLESLGIITGSPKYPAYSVLTIRMSTFQGWPSHKHQTPKYMAIAGFFYVGYDDYARCFYCGGGLKQWEVDDDPWIEHAKWFPLCSFVRQNKGDQFILLVQHSTKTKDDHNKLQSATPENLPAKSDSYEIKTVIKSVCEMGYSADLVGDTIQELRRENKNVNTDNVLDRLFMKEENLDMNISNSNRDIIPSVTPALNSLDVQSLEGVEVSCLHEDNKTPQTQRKCRICLNKDPAVAFLPCGHISCCLECAPAMRKCPVCKEIVKGSVKIYFA